MTATSTVQIHSWTKQEYENMVFKGIFHPEERLELIEGNIVNMTPQGSYHATAVQLAEDKLRMVFSKDCIVRIQMPLALDTVSEPEPDIAVVLGSPRDYKDMHPTTAILIVEVADTSLSHDKECKRKLYAKNNIPEFWIINLADRHLEIYRDPLHASYQFQTTHRLTETVSPLAKPKALIAVAELFP